MSTIINASDARMPFLNARAKFLQLGVNAETVDTLVMSQSYLRLETVLSEQGTIFNFPVLVNQDVNGVSSSATERRLPLQDAFFCGFMGLFFNARTLDPDQVGTNTDYRNVLMTYPDSYYFGSDGLGNRAMTFWNGSLKFDFNQKIIIPAWDTRRHLFIPQTQRPTAWGNFPSNTLFTQYSEMDGSQQGFYPTEPNPILWGDANMEITLRIPYPLNFDFAENEYRAVLIMHGVHVQNCTSVSVNRNLEAFQMYNKFSNLVVPASK